MEDFKVVIDEDMDIFKLVRVVSAAGRLLSPGFSTEIKCPYCHGSLVVSKSVLNGHIKAVCQVCPAKLIQ